jgi:hypothetical protein
MTCSEETSKVPAIEPKKGEIDEMINEKLNIKNNLLEWLLPLPLLCLQLESTHWGIGVQQWWRTVMW